MSMSSHNAGAAVMVTAMFRDHYGVLKTPTAAEYRLDDVKSGDEIIPWTVIPGTLDSTMEWLIGGEFNLMMSLETTDRRRVTVRFEYNVGELEPATGTGEYFYLCQNLKGIDGGSP